MDTTAAATARAFRTWITSDRVFIDRHSDPRKADYPMAAAKTGALNGHLEDLTGGERRLFLQYVFGKPSSKDLTSRERNALYLWLAPRCFEAGDPIPADYEPPDLDAADAKPRWWLVKLKCRAAAQAVVTAARLEAGQAELWTVTETQAEDEQAGDSHDGPGLHPTWQRTIGPS